MKVSLRTMIAVLLFGGVMALGVDTGDKTDQKENTAKGKCQYEQNITCDKGGVEKSCSKKEGKRGCSSRKSWRSFFWKSRKGCDHKHGEAKKECNFEGKDKQKGCCKNKST